MDSEKPSTMENTTPECSEPLETLVEKLKKCTVDGAFKHEDSEDWETADSSDTESDISDFEIDIIIQLKITLRDISPKIWRKIQVSSTDTFEELHYYIQEVMGWRMSHSHLFRTHDGTIIVDAASSNFYENMLGGKVVKEDEVGLNEFFREFGNTVMYEYDFGDDWKHEIVFEKFVLTPGNPNVVYPKCVGGKRACPPEDCGGVNGYEHLIHVLKHPEHEEYEELIENWLFEFYPGYNPEKFDKKKVFKSMSFEF